MRLGPQALSGLPDEYRECVQFQARVTDACWSLELQERVTTTWERSLRASVREALKTFRRNVQGTFSEPPLMWCAGWVVDPTTGE